MYLISHSQPHNAASVLELSRSLEFEHEVLREVTLQMKHCFGVFRQVDDADKWWEMDVEKVVRPLAAWVFCVSTRLVSAPHSSFLIDPYFCFWLTCRVTQYHRRTRTSS